MHGLIHGIHKNTMNHHVSFKDAKRQKFVEGLVIILKDELRLNKSKFFLTVRSENGLIRHEGMSGLVGLNPTNFKHIILLLDPNVDDGSLISTLCHEMMHVKQYALGQTSVRYTRKGKPVRVWRGREVKACYWDQPWEQDAWRREKILASRILKIVN